MVTCSIHDTTYAEPRYPLVQPVEGEFAAVLTTDSS